MSLFVFSLKMVNKQVSDMVRKTDGFGEPTRFQMDRFALQNGEWFYMTREGAERGPFSSKEDADDDLTAYLYHRHNIEEFGH